jgi:hypothetical protein
MEGALFPLFYEIFGSPSSASIPYSHNMEEPFSHYFMKYLGHPPPQSIYVWWLGELITNIKWRGETFVGYVFQKD